MARILSFPFRVGDHYRDGFSLLQNESDKCLLRSLLVPSFPGRCFGSDSFSYRSLVHFNFGTGRKVKMEQSVERTDGLVGKGKCDFEYLHFLLKAPSKDFVKKLLQDCFLHTMAEAPKQFFEQTANSLQIQAEEANQMILSLAELIRLALLNSITDPKEVFCLFPDDFHKNLRELLSKLIAESMPSWRSETVSQQVSLPRLADFDWRIDMKTGVSGRMAVPSCLLQLKVNNDDVAKDGVTSFNVELTKETLETMLDGLAKIRLQLSSVVSR